MGNGRTPQQQADDFVKANDRSPVVIGTCRKVTKRGLGAGAYYRLNDGTAHTLGREAHKLLPEGYPRWRTEEETHAGE